MRRARAGKRSFFTEMIRVSDLVYVPSVSDAIANSSEDAGSWDPPCLVATATGSVARWIRNLAG